MKADPNPYFKGAEINTENDIKSLQDMVYIQADKYKTSEFTLPSGLIFQKKLEYLNYHHDFAVQDGIVLYPPAKSSKGPMVLKKGDHVYTHHFLTDPDNEIKINGVLTYAIRYDMVYCIEKDGEIEMIGDWNFLEPLPEDTVTKGGIHYKPQKEYKDRYAIMKHPSESALELGIQKGDLVYFQKGADYKMKVLDQIVYRIDTKHFIAVVDKCE